MTTLVSWKAVIVINKWHHFHTITLSVRFRPLSPIGVSLHPEKNKAHYDANNFCGCPYQAGGAVQVTVGGWARGHLAAVGHKGEVDDTTQSLTILIHHSLFAGCHGYLSICPPIWRGWSLGRHPGKKKWEKGERKREKQWLMFKGWYNRLTIGSTWRRVWRLLWMQLVAHNFWMVW